VWRLIKFLRAIIPSYQHTQNSMPVTCNNIINKNQWLLNTALAEEATGADQQM
jgi:hypothetical protein